MTMVSIILVFIFFSLTNAHMAIQDLGGRWETSGTQPQSNVVILLKDATVPGCVHTDWMKGKDHTKDLYYGFNDVNLRWIAETSWIYSRRFQVDDLITNTYEQWIVFDGLDTISEITLNGKLLGRTSDMFTTYRVNISSLLQPHFNLLEVSFQSAVVYTHTAASVQPYVIPPACPPDVQHGFCDVNLIRKEQCSFSWDWGPAFATQGIWKPVYLMSLNYAVISEATATFDWESSHLEVDVQFLLVMFADQSPLYGNLTITIDELNITKHFSNISLPRYKNELTEKKFMINLNNVTFDRWWPNGYGAQKLYNISVQFHSSRGDDSSSKHFMFGFRKVELVQEPFSNSTGLSFYFRINDLPIFAKGANWIPADAFKNRIKPQTYENLLRSAADAHMNMLRVWGGGIYEDEEFYLLADKLGIMLWQDFMFACAMYPADEKFLANVTNEVSNVMWKLKHHPSVVIWAGNNENEAALSTNWYNISASHYDRYKKDYVHLYVDTLENQVKLMDSSRPFVTSSPSNGKETTEEGGVAKNPYDPHYGDVHYYNYADDCLDWSKYPATRFASEYGFQSWPSFETIKPVTTSNDWSMSSKWANHRQHHATGNKEMMDQISMHFKVPHFDNSTEDFINTIYMTQIMQALCYKSQTEFYRRSRNETILGAGHTMGALYWQLNDIWQAPTWSSIEYGGKWKAVHYFAMNFFSPVSLIVYEEDTVLYVYSASDVATPIQGTLVISIRNWEDFAPTGTFNQSVTIPPHKSVKLLQQSTSYLLHYGGCPYKEVCYISVHIEGDASIPTNYFFPVSFKNMEHLHSSVITIDHVSKIDDLQFRISLKATNPALFVWLEAAGLPGRFSDNAFIMSDSTREVIFYSWNSSVTAEKLQAMLSVKSLIDVYANEEDPFGHPPHPQDSLVTWLDDVTTKLVFSIIGILFIGIAAGLVICVVMRLNTPTKRPKSHINCAVTESTKKRRMVSNSSGSTSYSSNMSECSPNELDNEGTVFLMQTKGANARKTEFRFYVI